MKFAMLSLFPSIVFITIQVSTSGSLVYTDFQMFSPVDFSLNCQFILSQTLFFFSQGLFHGAKAAFNCK